MLPLRLRSGDFLLEAVSSNAQSPLKRHPPQHDLISQGERLNLSKTVSSLATLAPVTY